MNESKGRNRNVPERKEKPLQAGYLRGHSIGHFDIFRSSAIITSGRTIKQLEHYIPFLSSSRYMISSVLKSSGFLSMETK
jgi:hypothetical protein